MRQSRNTGKCQPPFTLYSTYKRNKRHPWKKWQLNVFFKIAFMYMYDLSSKLFCWKFLGKIFAHTVSMGAILRQFSVAVNSLSSKKDYIILPRSVLQNFKSIYVLSLTFSISFIHPLDPDLFIDNNTTDQWVVVQFRWFPDNLSKEDRGMSILASKPVLR